jgi:hypothetical protein
MQSYASALSTSTSSPVYLYLIYLYFDSIRAPYFVGISVGRLVMLIDVHFGYTDQATTVEL